jgi:hypothetical protein
VTEQIKRQAKGPLKARSLAQRDFLARKRQTHSRLDILIPNEAKENLEFLVDLYGKNKAEIIEKLIEDARKNCGFNDH